MTTNTKCSHQQAHTIRKSYIVARYISLWNVSFCRPTFFSNNIIFSIWSDQPQHVLLLRLPLPKYWHSSWRRQQHGDCFSITTGTTTKKRGKLLPILCSFKPLEIMRDSYCHRHSNAKSKKIRYKVEDDWRGHYYFPFYLKNGIISIEFNAKLQQHSLYPKTLTVVTAIHFNHSNTWKNSCWRLPNCLRASTVRPACSTIPTPMR